MPKATRTVTQQKMNVKTIVKMDIKMMAKFDKLLNLIEAVSDSDILPTHSDSNKDVANCPEVDKKDGHREEQPEGGNADPDVNQEEEMDEKELAFNRVLLEKFPEAREFLRDVYMSVDGYEEKFGHPISDAQLNNLFFFNPNTPPAFLDLIFNDGISLPFLLRTMVIYEYEKFAESSKKPSSWQSSFRKIQNLEELLDKFKAKTAQLQQDFNAQTELLELGRKKFTREIDQKTEELKSAKNEIAGLKNELSALRGSNAKLKQNRKTAGKYLATQLEQERLKLSAAQKDAESKLDALKKENAAARSAWETDVLEQRDRALAAELGLISFKKLRHLHRSKEEMAKCDKNANRCMEIVLKLSTNQIPHQHPADELINQYQEAASKWIEKRELIRNRVPVDQAAFDEQLKQLEDGRELSELRPVKPTKAPEDPEMPSQLSTVDFLSLLPTSQSYPSAAKVVRPKKQTKNSSTSGSSPYLSSSPSPSESSSSSSESSFSPIRSTKPRCSRSGGRQPEFDSGTKPVAKPSWDDECAICVEELIHSDGRGTDSYGMLADCPSCQSTFHKQCLTKWFSIDRSCPKCRRFLNSNDEFPLLGR